MFFMQSLNILTPGGLLPSMQYNLHLPLNLACMNLNAAIHLTEANHWVYCSWEAQLNS